jgi:hypothetical protein
MEPRQCAKPWSSGGSTQDRSQLVWSWPRSTSTLRPRVHHLLSVVETQHGTPTAFLLNLSGLARGGPGCRSDSAEPYGPLSLGTEGVALVCASPGGHKPPWRLVWYTLLARGEVF